MKTEKKAASPVVRERQIMQEVLEELRAIRAKMIDDVAKHASRLNKIHPDCRKSAENLLHYLVLRRRDRQELQDHTNQ